MTIRTMKSNEPKFERITITITLNGAPNIPVAARSIGNGLAWHDRPFVTDKAAKSRYKYRVSHIASGMAVWDFRTLKHAEQFIREVPRLADFTKSGPEVVRAVSNEAYNQMRRMTQLIEAGTYTPGCSL